MLENKQEIIEKIKFEIEKIKLDNTLIIVEGIKDKKALTNLGLNNIVILKKDINTFCEDISIKKELKKNQKKEIIILTDLDNEGKKLYSKIKQNLENEHIKINDKLRKILFKTDIRQIEGLYNYILRNEM